MTIASGVKPVSWEYRAGLVALGDGQVQMLAQLTVVFSIYR